MQTEHDYFTLTAEIEWEVPIGKHVRDLQQTDEGLLL